MPGDGDLRLALADVLHQLHDRFGHESEEHGEDAEAPEDDDHQEDGGQYFDVGVEVRGPAGREELKNEEETPEERVSIREPS